MRSKEGVMPKEVFEGSELNLSVRWPQFSEVEIGIESNNPIYILEDGNMEGPFHTLVMNFEDKDEFDHFIKVLKRAGRKTFG
jgi:hypothetical protein